jgi:Acyl-CoA reductase (LuxC)
MRRSVDDRIVDLLPLVRAARAVFDGRAAIAPEVARATGLTPEGVELGFDCLERDPSAAELRALATGVEDAREIHVILSANVFVAPLRAIAVARAAARRVTVRPSARDPAFACALVEAAGDDAIAIASDRDIASVEAGVIHVYGRDETIVEVRARARPGVRVMAHGAGIGVGLVTRSADVDRAAGALAADVVPFDQRGCLSPRVCVVEGDEPRARSFAVALDRHLRGWAHRVPRGELSEDEHGAGVRWRETMAFSGLVWPGPGHTVALAPRGAALAIPPPGRNVEVLSAPTLAAAAALVSPIAHFIVALGCDDLVRAETIAPPGARVSALGRMQRPPLDGPVDRRSLVFFAR